MKYMQRNTKYKMGKIFVISVVSHRQSKTLINNLKLHTMVLVWGLFCRLVVFIVEFLTTYWRHQMITYQNYWNSTRLFGHYVSTAEKRDVKQKHGVKSLWKRQKNDFLIFVILWLYYKCSHMLWNFWLYGKGIGLKPIIFYQSCFFFFLKGI